MGTPGYNDCGDHRIDVASSFGEVFDKAGIGDLLVIQGIIGRILDPRPMNVI